MNNDTIMYMVLEANRDMSPEDENEAESLIT